MIESMTVHRVTDAPPALTDRQQQVAELVTTYYRAAQEMPSSGWLARRLSISRQRASQHLDALRAKNWVHPGRR